jgi:hypothetical protein
MSLEEKKQYAQRLLGGKPFNHQKLGWLSTTEPGKVLQELATYEYYHESNRRKDFRISICDTCQGCSLSDANGRHRCGGEAKASSNTLSYITLVFPHDLIRHPIHGSMSWPCGQAGLKDYLCELGLEEISATTILKKHVPRLVHDLDIDNYNIGNVIVVKGTQVRSNTVAAALDLYIQARSLLSKPLGGLGDPFDDSSAYGAATATIIRHLVHVDLPLGILRCPGECGYEAIRPLTVVKQHQCPLMYGPLMQESGHATLAGYIREKGKGGVNRSCTVDERKVTSFFDLGLDVQRRIWEGATRKSDALYPTISVDIILWTAREEESFPPLGPIFIDNEL